MGHRGKTEAARPISLDFMGAGQKTRVTFLRHEHLARPDSGRSAARVLRRLLRGLSHRSRTHGVAPQAEIDQHWRTYKDGGIDSDENDLDHSKRERADHFT